MSYVVLLGGIFAVHVLALVSPGPNNLIVIQASVGRGRRAGIVTGLGLATGAGIWSSSALAGLSVLLTQYVWVYDGLRVLGGCYLLYLGIVLWCNAGRPTTLVSPESATTADDWGAFRLGFGTTLTNPKAMVFFASLFAALSTASLPMWVKMAAVGIIVIDATCWYVTLACFFSRQQVQIVYRSTKRWVDRISGTVLAVLGLWLIGTQLAAATHLDLKAFRGAGRAFGGTGFAIRANPVKLPSA